MKQLVILSGKGGTGKTTVASSFIELATEKAYADCDVDAPNLHLMQKLNTEPLIEDFFGYEKAVKHDDICINCGKCEVLCQFGAIRNGVVNPYECEGCGVCEAFCPVCDEIGKAIRLEKNATGITSLYKDGSDVFSSAELNMGNGASGKLVSQVRKNLYNAMGDKKLVIIDGSPGIGCPVIASITGVNMVLVVAEPTLSGIHDMERIIETSKKFGATCALCINKYDVNVENSSKIEEYCKLNGIPFVGRIPFDKGVVKGVNMGKSIVKLKDSIAKDAILNLWDNVMDLLFNKS